MTGYLHSIESMGTLDGPGTRCVVFLQGCPLRCVYCHNPDTWLMEEGETITSQALFKKILPFRPYWGKEGGVTLSGGEPLLQPDFVAEFFSLCRQEGIHTALDTSGAVHLAEEKLLYILQHTNLVLLDIKFTTEEEYQKHTGGSLRQVLSFLSVLEAKNIPTWIRQVLVPGLTDSEQNLDLLAAMIREKKNIQKVEFLPFRKLCAEKYEKLKIPFSLADVPEADASFCNAYAKRLQEKWVE